MSNHGTLSKGHKFSLGLWDQTKIIFQRILFFGENISCISYLLEAAVFFFFFAL